MTMRIGKGWERGGGIEHSFEKKIKDTLILKSMKLVRIMPASWKNFKFYLLVHQNLRDHRETTNVSVYRRGQTLHENLYCEYNLNKIEVILYTCRVIFAFLHLDTICPVLNSPR